MKKYILLISLFFIVLLFAPVIAMGETYNPSEGLVPCGNPGQEACTIKLFFKMLALIFDFIVKFIATPLAVLMLTIGGVMILISAGNPNLAGIGKKILWSAIIGLVLVFCSWLIISFILGTLGYQRTWNTL